MANRRKSSGLKPEIHKDEAREEEERIHSVGMSLISQMDSKAKRSLRTMATLDVEASVGGFCTEGGTLKDNLITHRMAQIAYSKAHRRKDDD